MRKCRSLRVPAFGAQGYEAEDVILNDVTLMSVTEAALEGLQVFPHESSLTGVSHVPVGEVARSVARIDDHEPSRE